MVEIDQFKGIEFEVIKSQRTTGALFLNRGERMTREKKPVTMPGEMEELKELAQPLVEFLREHYDPHCQVIVNMDFVKVTRDEIGVPFNSECYQYVDEALKILENL